jgi:hypothetical protein
MVLCPFNKTFGYNLVKKHYRSVVLSDSAGRFLGMRTIYVLFVCSGRLPVSQKWWMRCIMSWDIHGFNSVVISYKSGCERVKVPFVITCASGVVSIGAIVCSWEVKRLVKYWVTIAAIYWGVALEFPYLSNMKAIFCFFYFSELLNGRTKCFRLLCRPRFS